MTSRRLIRIKVLQLFYAFTKKENTTIEKLGRDLSKSMSSTLDLYYETILLILELRNKAEQKIDFARNRRFPSNEDLNPNLRFVENPILSIIANNNRFKHYTSTQLISWNNSSETVLYFYNKLTACDKYKEYMAKEDVDFNDHKDFILYIFTELIAQDELFFQTMEDKNIYWNDDFELTFNCIYKTINQLKESDNKEEAVEKEIFTRMFKQGEDEDFAQSLMLRLCHNHQKNMQLIEKHIQNWELDRISEIDKIIMSLALTELKHFASIPIKVSFDEYIEIAKLYSSSKSGGFINGVLDKAVAELKENNLILKTGRGLVETK